jgi:transglutaminase-like putative cysteine protease
MKTRILLFLLICCSAARVRAEETALTMEQRVLLTAAAAVTQNLYPDADTVLVEDITLLEYNPDGSQHYLSDVASKILTEKGREEKSTVTIGYDAAYGKTGFTLAEILKPDGRVVPIDLETQSRETIDSGQMDANIYDPNYKTIRLSVPDLQIGDVLHYAFRGERTKAVVPGTWSDLFLFEDTSPVLHAICQVDAPAERPLTRIELKDPVGDTVSYRKEKRAGGGIRHTWEARNVPQLFVEPKMPEPFMVSQRILLSTVPDWESLSKWYWELSKPRLDAVNDAMKAKVGELTGGLSERQEKIQAIFRFVSQDIRYMGLTLEDEAPGYEPHDVSLTFDNRYGVCRDKAALLASMLRLAGLDACPVLIYVGPKKDPDVPQPWFNHAITAVRNEDGSWQLMDSTDENTRDLLPAYLCNRSYLVATPAGEPLRTSPVIPPEDNMLTIEIDAELDDSNLMTATAQMSFDGINDTAYRGRLARLKIEERIPYFEERLKGALGAATLTGLDIVPADVRDTSVPLSVALKFELANAVVNGPDDALLSVPTLINHFGLFGALLGGGTGLDKREFPLHTQITCGVSETVRLNLSAGSLRPTVLPVYETVENPQIHISRSMTETNGLLVSKADLRLRTVEFSPEEYLQLKADLKTAERNARKRVLLGPGGFPREADFATLDEHIYYALYDIHNVAKLHSVKQKVLTYAGKKTLSDIKIRYNSGYEEVMLKFARVTAPDGTVREIDPESEVNVMDAEWSGSAPRYPADKIMVASLPGVEIGSVIEYQTLTTRKDIPFFSVMETFDSFNPIVRKTVQVEMSHKTKLQIGNLAQGVIRRRTYHNGSNTVHEWFVENRPMIRLEDHPAPSWILKPTLLLSTGEAAEYAKTVRAELMQAAKKTKSIKAKANELTGPVKGRHAKMDTLRKFVDREIRMAGPGLSTLPLSAITPAEQTLAEGYGNSTDRAVLLYALLDAAKLKPRFVLSSNLPRIADMSLSLRAIFQRQRFNTLLVAVEADDQVYYLGDSSRYAGAGTLAHADQPALDLDSGEFEFPAAVTANKTETGFAMTIRENGDVSLVRKQLFHGTDFAAFHKRFKEFTPEDLRREQQALLSGLSQSAESTEPLITSFKEPGMLQFSATLKNYAVRDGDNLYLTLPETLDNLLDIRAEQRHRGFYINRPQEHTVAYEIALPDGWRAAILPEPFVTELPAGAGSVECRLDVFQDKLRIGQVARLKPALIPVEDYDDLLDLHDKLTRPAARTILLKKR